MKCINLGSGYKRMKSTGNETWINIDSNPKCMPDKVRDLNKGLPFDDNSIDLIYSEHCLEHIQDLKSLMEECYRVLKEGGIFRYIVPYAFKGNAGFRHIEHVHFFTEDWYKCFTEWAELNDYNCTFVFIKQELKQDPQGEYYLEGEFKKGEQRKEIKVWKDKFIDLIASIHNEDRFMIFLLKNDISSVLSNYKEEVLKEVLTKILEDRRI